MKIVYLLLVLVPLFSCKVHRQNRNDSNEIVKDVPLGDSVIHLVKGDGIKDNYLLMNVHENEQTAIHAMVRGSMKYSIPYVYLHHTRQRRIVFSSSDTTYSIDPNRIFTLNGCIKTLKDSMTFSKDGLELTRTLAEQIIEELKDKQWLIAMHNNTDGKYSILSYQDGGEEAQNATDLYINPKEDSDDFVYTTNRPLFDFLKLQKINVVLQSKESFVDDGSMSVYCELNKIQYANIETQHGHLSKQLKLLAIIAKFFEL